MFLPNLPGATFVQGGTFIPESRVCPMQSYEIKLPSQTFLDGRFSPWRKLRQVGCYAVAKLRLVTLIDFNRENLLNLESPNGLRR